MWMKISVDPNKLASVHQKPAYLDLHCFKRGKVMNLVRQYQDNLSVLHVLFT